MLLAIFGKVSRRRRRQQSSRDFNPRHKYPTRLKKPASRARRHRWGGSTPRNQAFNVKQLMPSFVAVWRSLSLDSILYRPNAYKTSFVVTGSLLSVLMSGRFLSRQSFPASWFSGRSETHWSYVTWLFEAVVALSSNEQRNWGSNRSVPGFILAGLLDLSRAQGWDRKATPPVTKGQGGQVHDDWSLSVPQLSATATGGFESYWNRDIIKDETSHCRWLGDGLFSSSAGKWWRISRRGFINWLLLFEQ